MAADRRLAGRVRLVPTQARRVIAICDKCGKKLGGGFGEDADRSLAKLLRRALPATKGKRATLRVVETKCLDICPKGAVVLLDSLQPAVVVIVGAATPLPILLAGLGLAGGD